MVYCHRMAPVAPPPAGHGWEPGWDLDPERRRSLVREIDMLLQRDIARPMLYHGTGGTCWYPHVRGVTVGVNSIYNHWRFEDVWMAPR